MFLRMQAISMQQFLMPNLNLIALWLGEKGAAYFNVYTLQT